MNRTTTIALIGGCVLLALIVLLGGGTMAGGRLGGTMMGNAWMGSAGMGAFGWTGILLVLAIGVAALLVLGNTGKKS